MKLAILGTGVVGRTLAAGWSGSGHQVVMGTRDPQATSVRPVGEAPAAPTIGEVLEAQGIALLPLAAAAAAADVVVNATSGAASLSALRAAGPAALDGKVVLDVANPLEFSAGFPPTLSVCNDDSLAEQIARELPGSSVVKSLNTVNAGVMVSPPPGATMFVSGDDPAAKAVVVDLLRDLGWASIVDLGSLSGARGQEMYLALWVRTMAALGTPAFTMAIAMPDGTAAVTPAGPASDPTTRD